MTIKELKNIINNLPEETIVLVEENDVNDVETVEVHYHPEGSVHIILCAF